MGLPVFTPQPKGQIFFFLYYYNGKKSSAGYTKRKKTERPPQKNVSKETKGLLFIFCLSNVGVISIKSTAGYLMGDTRTNEMR